MYTNGNLVRGAHGGAVLLGTLGLAVLLVIAAVVLFFTRRAGARYSLLAMVALLLGYGLLRRRFPKPVSTASSHGATRSSIAGWTVTLRTRSGMSSA
jgi:HAMP domain-containing protein